MQGLLSLQDVLRDIERSYSRLADDITSFVFSLAGWFFSGSWAEIGLKTALLALAVLALNFTVLGGAKAMGDKKRSAAPIWVSIALVFGAGLLVAFVLM